MGVLWLVLGLLSLLVGERMARAEPSSGTEPESTWSLDDLDRHLALAWDAPEECPGERAVRERIRSLLRTRGEAVRRVHARATVTATKARYSLELVIEDGPARVLASETCVGLVEATSVIVALDIETRLSELRLPASPSAKPDRGKRSPGRLAVPSSLSPPVRSAAFAQALIDFGSLPRPTSGYRATLLLGYGAWSAEGAATAFVPRQADGPRQGTGASLGLVTGGLRVCRSWRAGSGIVALGTCIGGEVGRSSVAGFGISRPSTSAGLWTSVLASSEIRLFWNRALPLILGFEAGAVLNRSQAVVQGIGTIFDPDPWLVRGTVGLELEFFPSPWMK